MPPLSAPSSGPTGPTGAPGAAGAGAAGGGLAGAGPDQGPGIVAQPVSSAVPVQARDIRLVRNGANELALQYEFYNGTTEQQQAGLSPVTAMVLLVDPPRGTGYGALAIPDAPGQVAYHRLSATIADWVDPGRSVTVTAVFAAPPAEATSMLVAIDGVLPVQVPIQPAGSPALRPDPVLQATSTDQRTVGPLVCGSVHGGQTQFRLPSDVLFAFGSAALSAAAQAAIATLAKQVDGKSGAVTVQGNTDSVGADGYNQTLSEQRAAAVADAVKQRLTGGFSYTAVGFGKTRPVAPNTKPDGSDDPDGRARNRRVDVLVDTGAATPATAPLAAGSDLANAGLRAEVTSAQRVNGGYLLSAVRVTNPGTAPVPFLYANTEVPDTITTGELAVLEGSEVNRDALCTVDWTSYFGYIGDLSVPTPIPGGATVTLWGLTAAPAPAVTSVGVQVGGFPQPLPARIAEPH